MPTDFPTAEPVTWLIGVAGVAIILLAALPRVMRARAVPAHVVNAEPDEDGRVEVRLEEPGPVGARDTSLLALGSTADEPLGLAAGDRVLVRRPRPGRRNVAFVLTPLSALPGVSTLYGLMLILVAVRTPADTSNWQGLLAVAALAAIPLFTVGWLAGRCWFRLKARRVSGTVVDSRHRYNKSLRSTAAQALISYEIDGHSRQRWTRPVFFFKLQPGRAVKVWVDPRNPGNMITFGGAGYMVGAILAVLGLGLFGAMQLAFLVA